MSGGTCSVSQVRTSVRNRCCCSVYVTSKSIEWSPLLTSADASGHAADPATAQSSTPFARRPRPMDGHVICAPLHYRPAGLVDSRHLARRISAGLDPARMSRHIPIACAVILLIAVTAPSADGALVSLGLQQAGVHGGAITTVATDASSPGDLFFLGAYGSFSLGDTGATGSAGQRPLLNSSALVLSDSTGGHPLHLRDDVAGLALARRRKGHAVTG